MRVTVNRAPVVTLWTAVVAERLGFDRGEVLTLGRIVAGLNAYAKGKSLGLFKPAPEEVGRQRRRLTAGKQMHVELLHRAVPVMQTPQGLRALSKARPITSESVKRYLEGKFGDALPAIERAMRDLADSMSPDELAPRAYELYEIFRPGVPPGTRGWGAAGSLDRARIRAAAR